MQFSGSNETSCDNLNQSNLLSLNCNPKRWLCCVHFILNDRKMYLPDDKNHQLFKLHLLA